MAFCAIIILVSIGLAIIYNFRVPDIKMHFIRFLVFLHKLNLLGIPFEDANHKEEEELDAWFSQSQNAMARNFSQALMPREPSIENKVHGEEVEKKFDSFRDPEIFWSFFINIESYVFYFAFYVPCILLILATKSFDIIALSLLVVNCVTLTIVAVVLLQRIKLIRHTRKSLEMRIIPVAPDIIQHSPKKEKDMLDALDYLEKPIWIYPFFYTVYVFLSTLLGVITFLVTLQII